MLRLTIASSIALVAVACGGSSEGGSSSGNGSGGADSGGSAGQSGSSGQTGRDGGAGTGAAAGTGGDAGRGGSAGRGGASGSGAGVCGGIAGLTCDGDEWCDYPDNCGDGDVQGVCRSKPGSCTKDCPGVCGCDGNFYCNACAAQQQGIDVSPGSTCSDAGTPRTCTTDDDCGGGLKCCYPCGIEGCDNMCMAPDRNGECPLFP